MNYYPFHIGDYASKTRHLSWDEDTAYRRLMDVYYTTEKPIPLDVRQACRLVMAQTDAQREAVETVLQEFFEQTENGWVNHRVERELASMREKQNKQREKANKRWSKPQHDQNDAVASKTDAVAMPPTPTPTPTPTPVVKENPLPLSGVGATDPPADPKVHEFPPGFDRFWQAYPRKTAKPQAAKAFARLRPDEPLLLRMLAALALQRQSAQWQRDEGQFIPHPSTWLNGRRWEDELAAEQNDAFLGAV